MTTTRTYRLIDTDQHVNEPPDLWTARLPAKFAERAPRMQSFPDGDAWVLEGAHAPINFGLNQCAGKPLDEMKAWCRWDEVRLGGYIPAERLRELDADGVDATTLFPTPRLSNWIYAMKDAEFHLALVRAYNDWLSEYASYAPDRLGGLFIIPNRGVGMAVAEIERASQLPGMKGALLGCYPHGSLELEPVDDPVWGALAERELPVHIHVALVNDMPGANESKVPGDIRFFDAPKRVLQFVWTKVFDRFPALKLAVIEVDVGWLPYMKEQADDRYRRQGLGASLQLTRLPSDYIREHVWFSYITDHYGLRNRYDIGVDRMMWSSDFPHVGANWPTSWRVINAELSGFPPAERAQLLAANAQELYRFGG